MRYRTLAHSIPSLLLLLTIFLLAAAPPALAAEDDVRRDDDDGYEETARVVRVSLISGDVSLRRAGNDKWERAALNLPLVEGDRLATGSGSRVEIQIDARNFLRVGEYATIDIVTLRDEGVALSLPEGTATLRLARFDREREYFEIDAPGTTVAAQDKGTYRLDVTQDGKVRVSVRDGARARLYSQTSGFTLRDGRTAEMVYRAPGEEPDWEFSDVRPFDNWDTWVDERERYLLARLRHDGRDRYYDDSVWGAEELDAYGDWVQTPDYGYVWRPHGTVINNYHDWAPYRYGHWRWVHPYGWTWIADEPWGWAPYHYGRWVYVNNYWCWAPRGYHGYNRRRSWWRPALVVFTSINFSFGNQVCWYPLPYRHRDPHSNFWRRAIRERLTPLHQRELANLKRIPPIYQRAVTSLPARDFAAGRRAQRPADSEIARRAVTTDPVRGRLPLRPVEGDPNSPANLRERVSDSKRAAVAATRPAEAVLGGPTRKLTERPTGATTRKPGVALDNELRRERIFNNRAPVVTKGTTKDAGDGEQRRADEGRPTGAVARPARSVRLPDTGPDKSDVGRPVDPEAGGGRKRDPVTGEMPERRVRPSDGRERGDDGGGASKPVPEFRPERPDAGGPDPEVRKSKPESRESRPAPPQRERPDFTPPPVERREPPAERRESPRYDKPAPPRYERPEPRREERPSPPPREERRDPPPRVERHDPPPQREERPSPPPQREERPSSPPPQRESRPSPPPSKSEDSPKRERPPRKR